MCLAILKPASRVLPPDHIKNGWQGNSDGAGFAYVRARKVVVQKGFMTLKDFEAAYAEAFKKNPKAPFIVHFRIRTQGAKNEDNTHPFVTEHGALIHNGSIDGTTCTYNVGPSDTALFAQTYGNDLDFDTVDKHRKEFNEALGYNKVVLLYNSGKHMIINEQQGHWDNDIWYSNYSYKPRAVSRFAGAGGGSYNHRGFMT